MIILNLYHKIFLVFVALLLICNQRGMGQLRLVSVTDPDSQDQFVKKARITETDTLSLPIWDDFSSGSGIPNPDIWINSSGVYINYSLGINPPTLGVATFDGASASAGIYDPDPFLIGNADSLVSKPINLGSLGPTEINSVYLSFFWEFFGYPEIPDEEDSLKLLFKDQLNEWEVIDIFNRDRALSNDTFQYVIYKVEPRFLHTSFQFKFENIARLSGPYDSWHIDYIYLDKGRSITDRAFLDRAISNRPDYIFNGYSALPMEQFISNPGKFIIPSKIDIYNLDAILQPIEYTAILRNTINKDQIIDTLNYNTEVNPPLQGFQRRNLILNSLDIDNLNLSEDSIYITMDFYISSGDSISEDGINFRVNDTTSFDYVLDNFYATDDGTAEFGLGMEQQDAQLAYMFILEEPDVLNRVDIHFPNIGRIQAGSAFNLRVWRRLTDNPDDLLFERQDVVIEPISDFNQFQSIRLSDVLVTDTFYIGYEQRTTEFMAVGFDKQHDSGDRIFFNVLGGWLSNDEMKGSLMIRPYFGDAEPTGLEAGTHPNIKIFPNPTDGIVRIEGEVDIVEVYDLLGKRLIVHDKPGTSTQLDLSLLDQGIYIIRLFSGRHFITEKIIKNR
jgi:hypothetical protein